MNTFDILLNDLAVCSFSVVLTSQVFNSTREGPTISWATGLKSTLQVFLNPPSTTISAHFEERDAASANRD